MVLSMTDFDVKKFFLNWRMWLVVLAILSFLWSVPKLQVGQVDGEDEVHIASLEDEYRRTLAQILGGLALLYGLYLTQRRVVATEENVRVAQEGQVTERFTRAIEQLGHEETAIKLGGIYALERIAKDSEKDHGPIMEVLTAYVREKAPRQQEYTPRADERPPADIQAILTVIGRRETTGKGRRNDRLNLSKTHLVGADLSEADLSEASLAWADLRLATLTGAKLNKADFFGTELTGAKLRGATNLIAEQILSTENWRDATLPAQLEYLEDTPKQRA